MSCILTLNAGSSSIKFAVYQAGALTLLAHGQVERIGKTDSAGLQLTQNGATDHRDIGPADHAKAMTAILTALEPVLDGAPVLGVGHRIVHGGKSFHGPAILTQEVMTKLEALVPLAPLHQPNNLAAIRASMASFPGALQLGCFDTSFHRNHPWVADTFALPRHFYDEGLRRYGFHGLSYDYLSGELARLDPVGRGGRCVMAHLGNGASMCALRDGQSVDSSMGFTALDGLPMGSRCGRIDPGVLLYLMQDRGMDAQSISELLYNDSGLLGLSGLSSDMRTLETAGAEAADQAIAYFVHEIRRELGAMAVGLGGLDTVVFSGGIGEHSARVRAEVCRDLDWLGIKVDADRNAAGQGLISTGTVNVRVIPTNEEIVIARAVNAKIA